MTRINLFPNIKNTQNLKNRVASNIISMNNHNDGFVSSTQKKSFKGKKMLRPNLPKEISEVVKSFKNAKSPLDLCKTFSEIPDYIKGVYRIDETTLAFKDFCISSVITSYANKIEDNLNLAKKWKLTTAPELVAHEKNGIGESLIITKIKDFKHGTYRPIQDLTGFGEDTTTEILGNAKTIYDNGYVLNNINSYGNVIIDTRTGRPYIKDWIGLEKQTSPDDCKRFLTNIKEIIS